jgi:hypothetical protein
MKEKGNPTRSRLRRGLGLGHKKPRAWSGEGDSGTGKARMRVTRDFSRDITIVGVLKSALDRVWVCVTIPRYHRAGELRGKMADRPSLRPTAFGRNYQYLQENGSVQSIRLCPTDSGSII